MKVFGRYRVKQDEGIEAIQYTGEKENLAAILRRIPHVGIYHGGSLLKIPTDTGVHAVREGDWIVLYPGSTLIYHNDYFQEYFCEG